MNTISITAGEMMSMNNDLYQMCKRFIKNRLNNESYTISELRLDFYLFLYDYFNKWYEKTNNKPFISTNRIDYLIHRVLRKEFDTLADLSAYVRLLADELKYLLEQLSETDASIVLYDGIFCNLDGRPRTFTELDIDLSNITITKF